MDHTYAVVRMKDLHKLVRDASKEVNRRDTCNENYIGKFVVRPSSRGAAVLRLDDEGCWQVIANGVNPGEATAQLLCWLTEWRAEANSK